MYRSMIILSLIFIMSFLSVPAWGGEGRYVIEEDTEIAPSNNMSDAEQCKKAFEAEDYVTAYPICRNAAEQGDADSQYALSSMYFKGQGVKQDNSEAAVWLRKAALQNHTKAQYSYGMAYDKGIGVKHDYIEAERWLRKSAENGNARAQTLIASYYFLGLGVKQDYTEAKVWSLKAAEQGHAPAQLMLGILSKQNYAEAAKWYRKAAEQGYEDAQYFLGLLYVEGKGVKQDSTEAAVWFRKAAGQGNVDAQSALDLLYKGSAETVIWYRKEAELGNSYAQYELAKRYIAGDGVEKNRHLAEKWLFHSISNENNNNKSIEFIEKEFGWHCIINDDYRCTLLINKTSINHAKNLSWYWSQTNLGEVPYKLKDLVPNSTAIAYKSYDVINCDNRTFGNKTTHLLNENLSLSFKYTKTDSEIEFKPLDTGTHDDRLFNYVCRATAVGTNIENIKEVSFGTGWPIQQDFIVTNQHVINGKTNIAVMLATGERISATLLIEDKINDLALLQVNQLKKLPPAIPLSRISSKTGSKVFTIGYPHPDMMGAKSKLTEGIVNAVTGYKDDPRTIQISAPVQAGNSGGPLLNMNGEVVGIVTAKLSAVKMFNWTGDLPQNVNYAVKIPYLSALISSVDEKVSEIKTLSAKPASLETLASRIQNSVLMIIAE